jgi:hypothetical protein
MTTHIPMNHSSKGFARQHGSITNKLSNNVYKSTVIYIPTVQNSVLMSGKLTTGKNLYSSGQ